jgi:hypothetical protein
VGRCEPSNADLGMEIDQQMQADPPAPERQPDEPQTLSPIPGIIRCLIYTTYMECSLSLIRLGTVLYLSSIS